MVEYNNRGGGQKVAVWLKTIFVCVTKNQNNGYTIS